MELTLSEKRRKARMSWGWTSERRAKLAATRTRMIADGTISAPPASLGGKARALLAKEQYGGDCMSPEARTRQLETMRKQFERGERTIAPQTREAVRQANLRRSDDIGRMNRERIWTNEIRHKLSETRKAKFASGELTIPPEARAKIGAAHRGRPAPWMERLRGIPRSPEICAKISMAVKAAWHRPGQKERQVLAVLAGVKVKPNGLERAVQTYLDIIAPETWKYNSGALVVAGKVPDFYRLDGLPVCIDVHGDYWHRGQRAKDRIAIFREHGYQLIVVWEREFTRRPEILAARLHRILSDKRRN